MFMEDTFAPALSIFSLSFDLQQKSNHRIYENM